MKKLKIEIDGKRYETEGQFLNGSQLRNLASIPLDKSLVLEVPNAPDIDIINDQDYILHDGMKFFSEIYELQVLVKIDGKEYIVNRECSGKELRDIVGVANDCKLIKEVKNAQDLKIEDNVRYELDKDDVFFIVPSGINNGGK